jgi:hypothetical protein
MNEATIIKCCSIATVLLLLFAFGVSQLPHTSTRQEQAQVAQAAPVRDTEADEVQALKRPDMDCAMWLGTVATAKYPDANKTQEAAAMARGYLGGTGACDH